MVNKQIAVFINTALEAPAQKMMFEKGMLLELEKVAMACNS